MRTQHYHTNEEYIEGLKEAFRTSQISTEIIPVYCIPDYKSWFGQKGVMDEHLENFARFIFYFSYCYYNIPK